MLNCTWTLTLRSWSNHQKHISGEAQFGNRRCLLQHPSSLDLLDSDVADILGLLFRSFTGLLLKSGYPTQTHRNKKKIQNKKFFYAESGLDLK